MRNAICTLASRRYGASGMVMVAPRHPAAVAAIYLAGTRSGLAGSRAGVGAGGAGGGQEGIGSGRGPMYSDCGRIRRLARSCSKTCAVQPATRPAAKIEVNGRRYPAVEVEALRGRVEAALDWGLPVLDSRLTLIAGGRLFYRGWDAVQLARRGEALERVASLLWLGDLDAPLPGVAPWRLATLPGLERELAARRSWRPFARLQSLLPLVTADDPGAFDLRPPAVVASGAWLLQLVAAIAAGSAGHLAAPAGAAMPRVAAALAHGWAPVAAAGAGADTGATAAGAGADAAAGAGAETGAAGADADSGAAAAAAAAAADPVAARLLDVALVLSADHELNVSAFTARCVASAAAPPQAAVAAALAALGGARHGGHCDRVEALFAEMSGAPVGAAVPAAMPTAASGAGASVSPAGVRERLAGRLRRGEEIPGFGQPLYPDGDPRARLLLELAAAHRPASAQTALAAALAAAGFELLGERPNLDFGLVALAWALDLPPGAALALFAVGRTTGWIAHVLEQYADARLIRPRARYVGTELQADGCQDDTLSAAES